MHFFALDSNKGEQDRTSSTSAQARWLRKQLAASTSRWNIVYDHHPPYASDNKHGPTRYMRWPFAKWGADAVLSGHAHVYERVMHDGIPYFINGLGGATRYKFARHTDGSVVRYCKNCGAQKVTVTTSTVEFAFYSESGRLVDRYQLKSR